jgi:hypothetical protein
VTFDYFSFDDVLVLGSTTDVNLVCTSGDPHSHVQDVSMNAMQLGSVTDE